MQYDIIGDVHGHVNDLRKLLKELGYGVSQQGHYYHPDRQAIFVGDYIDRGIHSRQVVELVMAMQRAGSAIALMGNHEYNALCYHTEIGEDEYLRNHSSKNIAQHCATLVSFGQEGFLKEALEWFYTLPVYWEDASLRVVHACWDPHHLDILRKHLVDNRFTPEVLPASADKKSDFYDAVEVVLKGRELELPKGRSFLDKDDHKREEIRVKWWEHPEGRSYRDYAVKIEKGYEDLHDPVPTDKHIGSIYGDEEKPVFFGHYWLENPTPELQKHNVCCLDYSVAKKGKLVAYRFNGETELNPDRFVSVISEK